MTDAEKYAKIFRAAADGICPQHWGAWYDAAVEENRKEDPTATTAYAQSREAFVMRERDRWLRGNQNIAAAFLAYEGIALMFEKIVEAEKLA